MVNRVNILKPNEIFKKLKHKKILETLPLLPTYVSLGRYRGPGPRTTSHKRAAIMPNPATTNSAQEPNP